MGGERDGLRVTVVTGLSGAGKTTALASLADLGFYVVDNLPPSLAAELVDTLKVQGVSRVALGIDIRVGTFLDELADGLAELRDALAEPDVLYLEATEEVLVRRFSETRRPHPMLARRGASTGSAPVTIAEAVRLERERMIPVRAAADRVMDTSELNVHQLRRRVIASYADEEAGLTMRVNVMSFGFKHGVPLDADVMFDVRFLDNPHFVPGLREKTGMDPPVRDFVLATPGAVDLLDKLEELLRFALPRYNEEGKSNLTIAIGCTGGRHRSVALATELARRLGDGSGQTVGIVHRDVTRGAMMSEVTASRESRSETDHAPDGGEGVGG